MRTLINCCEHRTQKIENQMRIYFIGLNALFYGKNLGKFENSLTAQEFNGMYCEAVDQMIATNERLDVDEIYNNFNALFFIRKRDRKYDKSRSKIHRFIYLCKFKDSKEFVRVLKNSPSYNMDCRKRKLFKLLEEFYTENKKGANETENIHMAEKINEGDVTKDQKNLETKVKVECYSE